MLPTGRYREVGLLAEGGMALVAQAEREDGLTVVLKRVRPPFCFDAAYLRLFGDEGRVHAALDHPHVVRLLDRGEDEAGPYLVFEHVDGSDLALVLEARAGAEHARERALDVACVLAVALPLFKALSAVHEARDVDGTPLRVVHRDVSPGNILLGADGDVKLADFGVAASALKSEHTVAGELKGKFAYMAPEQTRGEPVDARTDLFAAGIVLWECLAGRRLFDGPTDADVVAAVRTTDAPRLEVERPEVPLALASLVARLLAKSPQERPGSAREVADALEGIALECGLDEGLRRHAARLARAAPRQAPRARELDRRRHTQRVVGAAPAGAVAVRAPKPQWRARAVALTAGLGAAIFVGALAVTREEPARARGEDVVALPLAPTDGSLDAAPPMSTDPSLDPSLDTPAARRQAIATPSSSPLGSRPGVTAAPGLRGARAARVEGSAGAGPSSLAPQARASVAPGKLSVTSEPWASVTVDGTLVARETPLRGWALPPGKHVVVLENPVYGRRTLEVDVGPGEDVRRFIDLTR